jgi:hypothetical protein
VDNLQALVDFEFSTVQRLRFGKRLAATQTLKALHYTVTIGKPA